MAVQSRIGLQSDINTDLADNTVKDITAAEVRGIVTDLNDSTVNKTTDTNLIGWYPFDATKDYYTNELVIYSGNLYQFNQNHSVGAWNTAHADLYNCTGATQFTASLAITSAQVKSLNSIPLTIVNCPTNKNILVTGCSMTVAGTATAYAVEADVILLTAGANLRQATFDNVLTGFGAVRHVLGALYTPSYVAGDSQIVQDGDLLVSTPSADPTTGTWACTVYVTFRLI